MANNIMVLLTCVVKPEANNLESKSWNLWKIFQFGPIQLIRWIWLFKTYINIIINKPTSKMKRLQFAMLTVDVYYNL